MTLHPGAPLPLAVASRPPLPVRLRRTALAVCGGLAFAALLYAKGVPCLFARLLHMPCPGCGSTRAVICLLHGDLDGVIHMNPLGPVAAVLLGLLGLQAIASVLAWGDFRTAGEGRFGRVVKRALVLVAVLEVLLWAARFFGVFGGPVPVG